MQGFVGIENYKISCIMGAHPDERTKVQEIYVDLRVRANMARCVSRDRLKDAIDYTLLAKMCKDLALANRYRLLETYAAEVFERFAPVRPDRLGLDQSQKTKGRSGRAKRLC